MALIGWTDQMREMHILDKDGETTALCGVRTDSWEQNSEADRAAWARREHATWCAKCLAASGR
jgi:hypothetical protein